MIKLATLIYVQQDNQTLMIYRNKKENDEHQGKRNGLGGKLEPGESPDQCCIRELEEESGLHATQFHLKGILTAPAFTPDNDWYIFVYIVTEHTGNLKECNEGELHRINNNDILDLNLRDGDRAFIPYILKPGFFRTTMYYTDGQCTNHELTHQII